MGMTRRASQDGNQCDTNRKDTVGSGIRSLDGGTWRQIAYAREVLLLVPGTLAGDFQEF
jgi:hypothetical protein